MASIYFMNNFNVAVGRNLSTYTSTEDVTFYKIDDYNKHNFVTMAEWYDCRSQHTPD